VCAGPCGASSGHSPKYASARSSALRICRRSPAISRASTTRANLLPGLLANASIDGGVCLTGSGSELLFLRGRRWHCHGRCVRHDSDHGTLNELLAALDAAGAEHPQRPRAIGIAGYPENHPLIPAEELERALRDKSRLAD
jgi:hypothetical protein